MSRTAPETDRQPRPAPSPRRPTWGRRSGSLLFRLSLWALEIVAALVAGVLLAAGLLLWRVSHGPFEVTFLTPYIERALNRPDAPLRIDIGETALSWIDGRSRLGVLARDVALRPAGSARDAPALATMPAIALSFRPGALLRGELAPAHVEIEAGHVALVRTTTGALTIGGRPLDQLFAPEPAEPLPPAAPGPEWSLERLLGPARPDDPLATLSTVAASDLRIDLDDRQTGHEVTATVDDLLVYRGEGGLSAAARLVARTEGKTIAFGVRLGYGPSTHLAEAGVQLERLDPSSLPEWFPFAPLRHLHAAVSGSVSVAVNLRTGVPGAVGVDLTGEAGRADFPPFAGGSLPFDGFHANLLYDPARQRLTAKELTVDLGHEPGPNGHLDAVPGPRLKASFVVDGVDPRQLRLPASAIGSAPSAPESAAVDGPNRWTVEGDAHLDGLSLDRVAAYWPQDLAANARAWIVPNITAGSVDGLATHVRLTVDPGNPGSLTLNQLKGAFRFEGLTVHYFKPLPPAEAVAGTATFDQNRMDLTATGGHVGAVDLENGAMALTQFQAQTQAIAIDVTLASAIRDQLTLVDMKPLGFLSRLGQSPRAYGGQAETHLSLNFPLRKALRTDSIDIKATADLHQLSVARAALDRDISDGEARLTVDTKHLTLDGTARLAGVPATVEWLQNFSSAAPVQARYHAVTRLDDRQRHALGIDVPADRLNGRVGVDLTYAEFAGGRSELQAALDLDDAALALEEAGWSKPRGGAAKAAVTAEFVGGHITALPTVTVEAPDLSLAASASFAADGRTLTSGHFTRLSLGRTRLAGSIVRRAGGGWQVRASGPTLDLSALLGRDDRESEARTKTAEKPAERQPIALALETDRLILGAHREIRQVALDGLIDGDGVEQLRAQGHVDAPAPVAAGTPPATVSAFVRLQLGDAASGHRFNVETSNLGTTLRGLDVGTHVHGGRATIVGRLRDVEGQQVWSGTVFCGPFSIVGAGVLARLLSLASLSGIGNLLTGAGIPFTRAESDFTLSENRITLSDARASGGAIGITLSGTVDRDRDTLDLSGTLVPAYTLNSSLGSLPIVGPLLLGGEGQGLFGANFRLSGPTGDPHITVNPLSVFAPGFLRRLFIFDAPGSGTAATGH